ncbi:MAG: alpha/beta hydrolase-fold protein [Rudaea sp.]|uniref:alpha/beta hydrolase family protein n=1 Tax=Rudaea sp. TaxID=2136325 RepID=UPI0039E2A2EE
MLFAPFSFPQVWAETKTATEIGTLAHASYRIDIPADWNYRVVVFFHGTSETPVTFRVGEALSPMFAPLLQRKYAVIQSGYSAGGWALEEAAQDTERLRQLFVAKHGLPMQFLVTGMSMGGTLAAMTIEQHPDVYAGALSLCGAIEPSDAMFNRDFALAAAFDFYFPGVLPPLASVPAGYVADEAMTKKIAAALATKPAAIQLLLRWYGTADTQSLPDIIADTPTDFRDLQHRAGGNPLGNADLIYVNSGDDAALNAGVRRYRADANAAAWLARWYTPSGKLIRPMLALHDIGDPLVPAAGAFAYALAAQRAGRAGNFVQQYVDRSGHCVFTPDEIARAFDQLVGWIDSGMRPVPGALPPSVAHRGDDPPQRNPTTEKTK